jgi:3-phosphoshikimate 1-carboxyvinyltransferase
MLSAMMMVAPLSSSEQQIKLSAAVREPFVEMTRRLGQSFGQTKGHYHLRSGIYSIEPDATAASYFLALPLATGGALQLPRLRVDHPALQGDLRFVDVLRKIGLTISEVDAGSEVRFDRSAPGKGVSENFNEFSDTFLTLAAIAPLLEGPTRITGIAHTRKQETDRVAGAARELKKLGQEVIETEDSIEIRPQPLRAGQTIETYGDHRFAMSFAVLGCHDLNGDGRPWLSIRDPACSAKTFPNFFDLLDSLRPKPRSSR